MNPPEPRLPIKVGVDQGVDLRRLRRLQDSGALTLFQAHDLEQQFRQVAQQGRAFRLDVSTLDGPDRLADERFEEVRRLLGRDREIDAEHLYACCLNGNEYFLTENVKDFTQHGRRETLQALLGVKIRRTQEFLDELRAHGLSIE